MLAANPTTPQPVRDVAIKIADKAEEMIDRVMRTFDQIRDPSTFVLEITEELAALEQQMPQDALGQMAGMLTQGGGAFEGQSTQPLGIEAGGVG